MKKKVKSARFSLFLCPYPNKTTLSNLSLLFPSPAAIILCITKPLENKP